jgi:hypothetical protein
VRLFANHGQEKRYHHKYVGLNGRMDTLQAAVVRVKLKHFEQEILERNRVAASYTRHLSGTVDTPRVLEHNRSTWAQYTIRSKNRDEIQKILTVKDIPTANSLSHAPAPAGGLCLSESAQGFSGFGQSGLDCFESSHASLSYRRRDSNRFCRRERGASWLIISFMNQATWMRVLK